MLQQGRKSGAQLSVVVLPGQRHEPPRSFTKDQAAIWRAVVATKEAAWFSVDSHPLLAAYCRHTATADLLAAQINAIEAGTAKGDYAVLLSQREHETNTLLKLATSMRLTQHTRYKSETAATKAARSADANKPWANAVS